MKLVVGLGNVGEKYKINRHNAGFLFIDRFSSEVLPEVFAKKSNSMMNCSGEFVFDAMNRYGLDKNNLYIAHDDLDLGLGSYKIQFGRGPKVHNGVNSVEVSLRTVDFWRIRIGVDNRNPTNRIPGEKYVLENFTQEELQVLKCTYEKIIDDLLPMLKNGE